MKVITNREVFYNLSDGAKAGIATGVTAATALGVAAVSKQKTLSEIEQKCGKRPRFGKNKKAQWQQCAASQGGQVDQTAQTAQNGQVDNKKPMSKNLKMGLIIGSSLLVVALIGFVIYKRRKK